MTKPKKCKICFVRGENVDASGWCIQCSDDYANREMMDETAIAEWAAKRCYREMTKKLKHERELREMGLFDAPGSSQRRKSTK